MNKETKERTRPRSQSFSSLLPHPPGAIEERPWHRLVTCYKCYENIREAPSLIRQFVALSFVEFKASHYDCHYPRCLNAISNTTYSNVYLKISKSVLRQFTMLVMLLPSYQLVTWKVGHISSSSFVAQQQNQLWTWSSAI